MDATNDLITTWLEESVFVKNQLLASRDTLSTIHLAAEQCADACRKGAKVLFAGNGGSAADSQHLAGEFVSRFNYDRPGLSSFALTVDTSVLTAIGNDYGYERVFARQVQACGKPGDVLIALSTSGNSPNILKAIEMATEIGLFTIGMTGQSGGKMAEVCDLCIRVPSSSTPRIQEAHITIGHIICGLVELSIFPQHAQS